MKIKINGKYYSFFDEVLINERLDSVASVFSFKGRFNPNNQTHKEIFKPLSFHKIEIYDDNDDLKLTGVSVNSSLGSSSTRELQNVSGYSLPGILEDCSIPFKIYPLEKNNVSLDDIVKNILPEFGLEYVVDSSVQNDMKLQYEKTTANPSDSVKDFLSKLAAQRNIVISHTVDGRLLFFKPNINAKPKLFLTSSNTLRMSMTVSGQMLHSKITVIRQPSKDNPGLSPVDTITNPMLSGSRNIVKVLTSGTETETKKAADNVLADELKNISFTVEMNKIYDDLNCGDIVEVQNPEVYLYNRAKLMVSEISKTINNSSNQMTLKLVMPETFTGAVPKNIFE